MKVQNEDDITRIIKADDWMMQVLQAAEILDLPNWWIGAGFLRNKVWDTLADIKSSPSRDVDLAYFSQDTSPEIDWQHDEFMKSMYPFAEWEVRNQARMHYVNKMKPFTSTEDAISNWVETATCIGVKLHKGELRYLFCHGMDDLLNLTARPTLAFQTPHLLPVFHERVKKKAWKKRWPQLKVVEK